MRFFHVKIMVFYGLSIWRKILVLLDWDVNAAFAILNFALTGFVTGREPALSVEESKVTCSLKHETPPIPEQAH